MKLKQKIIITKEYYKAIKKYEKNIISILNESKIIFEGNYKYIEKQSNGECDFVNITTGEKLDAKLLFDEEICKSISTEKDFQNAVELICNYINIDIVANRDTGFVNTELYKEMEDRISSLKECESGILIFPFPALPYVAHSIGAGNIFDSVFYSYIKNNPQYKNNMYLITINDEGLTILQNLRTGKYELMESSFYNIIIESSILFI